ncbi:MAG: GNAT family N-acetyltransferase [Thomasclavelia sp.]|jgi:ribosomal protein S18 acetylase RimI-like enzyme|nr:GNAT family N-acetyltransferase [Thomasclavelia sp.]
MNIRKATKKDVSKVSNLLSQVLEIHADIRPDIFISGTTKYTKEELIDIFNNDSTPVYVAVDDNDDVVGYAFCVIQNPSSSNNMIPFKSLFIDDLCVDSTVRGKHIGQKLFAYVKQEAIKLDCYEVTLNVWEGNDSAKKFYEKIGFKPKETQMEFILK